MEAESSSFWRKCSTCKKPIQLGAKYFVCSVSTCNGDRTGYVFCSMNCFEAHLPGARHRSAGAIEKFAPKNAVAIATGAGSNAEAARAPARIIVSSPNISSGSTGHSNKTAIPREVLIIASRLKEYIQARADFNTSASVMDVLSDHMRILCDRAIDHARAEGRKTVLDRDFEFLKNSK